MFRNIQFVALVVALCTLPFLASATVAGEGKERPLIRNTFFSAPVATSYACTIELNQYQETSDPHWKPILKRQFQGKSNSATGENTTDVALEWAREKLELTFTYNPLGSISFETDSFESESVHFSLSHQGKKIAHSEFSTSQNLSLPNHFILRDQFEWNNDLTIVRILCDTQRVKP